MLVDLPLVSINMSDISFGIDAVTVISPILRIDFAKTQTNIEIVLSMTLLFGRMLSLVKRFH